MTHEETTRETQQFDFFGEVSPRGWPAHSRFPYNDETITVGAVVTTDLLASRDPLVITGYASLDRLIDLLAHCNAAETRRRGSFVRIRLVLGHEPKTSKGARFHGHIGDLSREVADYWLSRGISLHLSAKLLAAIELLQRGILEARTSADRAVHAKMYVGDHAITMGSSNYSTAGLYRQVEINTRFSDDEPQRFEEARRAAEVIWAGSRAYTAELMQLLNDLLSVVSWQEALGRACAELLEGKWAARYLAPPSIMNEGPILWPSQEQGIAHALWILENQGSVLIADATGSGKTLMGAHLAKRIMHREWRAGTARDDIPVLMAPPSVLDVWQHDAMSCGLALQAYSLGHLSHPASDQHELLRRAIRRAQLLLIDEAHNFLRRSLRTKTLFSNMADHVLLFTATPVSRGPRDMLAIIDLLGADNLDEETLVIIEQLWRRHGDLNETMSAGERETLQRAIRRFTLRRTKAELNRMIARQPEAYRDKQGRQCRYPQHRAVRYETGETTEDRTIAAQIRETASRLRGMTRLRSALEVSDAQRREGISDEGYLSWRLRGAAALAAHQVMASLRSSRDRLTEHLSGTDAVRSARPRIAQRKSRLAGVIELLNTSAGSPPPVRLECEVPAWLGDPEGHAAACSEELQVYEEIRRLSALLSDSRERTKVELLLQLSRRHALVLAFDTHLITLASLADYLADPGAALGVQTIVVTSDQAAARRHLHRSFRPGSSAKGIIALCSDAISEGLNLQAASVVVLLDQPTVLRVAEQRIGRVDRLDNPHEVIEAYWPNDSDEFALRASERFVERHRFVADHLGSNLPLPEGMASTGRITHDPVVRVDDDMAELESRARESSQSDELLDAFAPVRALVEGDRALVPADVYEAMRRTTARVVSSVSVVEAPQEFAFVAVKGTQYGAPRWAYLPTPNATPVTDLDVVSEALRRHFGEPARNRPWDVQAAEAVDRVLIQLENHEELLLPRGKRRALVEMRHVLTTYRRTCPREDRERLTVLDDLISATKPGEGRSFNLVALAEWWLHVIQPLRHRHLLSRRRTAPLLLKHLRADLRKEPLSTATLRTAFEYDLEAQPLAERVAAAIVGVTPLAEACPSQVGEGALSI
jgi:superfamily II DNA or RNA helicase